MAKYYTSALLALTSLASYAAIPVRWTTDAYKVKPLVYECYHGETLDLAAALTAYGEPLDFAGKTARLYWQTNGMESAWWSTNAFVRAEAGATNILAAIWSGAYDAGAASVTGFIGVEGDNYRAAFQLNFRPSPGFVPNQMPIPPKTIDWANVANANVESAPFVVKGGTGGVTLQQVTNVANDRIDAKVADWAMRPNPPPSGMTTNQVSNLITNHVESGYLCTSNAAVALAGAAEARAKAEAADMTNAITFAQLKNKPMTLSGYGITDAYTKTEANVEFVSKTTLDDQTIQSALTAPNFYGTGSCTFRYIDNENGIKFGINGYVTAYSWEMFRVNYASESDYEYLPDWLDENYLYTDADAINAGRTNGFITAQAATNIVKDATNALATVAHTGNYTDLTNKPTIPSLDGYATEDYVDTANATTRAIVQTWEGFLDGSNVVFSITNYLSGSYTLDTAKLRILEMTNGVYREVYNSRGEIVMHLDAFKTNDFRVATNRVIAAVNAAVANKADRAWGKYTSAGGDAPSNTVYMTAPNTVFAGGMEYERVAVGEGAVCVLTTKGAPVWTQGDEGTFKFQDDGGTNYFGFAKTDSYVIGANTDGITVQSNIVTLEYDVTMSGVPCIWYKADLATSTPWEQLNTPDGNPIAGASHIVQWETNPPAGQELCYINCPEAKGFFKATIEVPGSAKFMTNMPADLGGGIFCTNTATGVMGKIKPSYNGSQVIWTWSGL